MPGDALVSGCNKAPSCSLRRGACMVADDQFALVPRPYASAYFAQCRALGGSPAVLADASVKLTMASRVAVTGPNGAGKVRVTRWRPALVGVS